jgi:hypothetical protein
MESLVGCGRTDRWSPEDSDFRIVKVGGQRFLVFDIVGLMGANIWADRKEAMTDIVRLFKGKKVNVKCNPLRGSKTAFAIIFVSAPRNFRFPDVIRTSHNPKP